MNILIAPDKFKESLSAEQVCRAIEQGIHRFDPTIKTWSCPLADGGDGSLEILSHYYDLEKVQITVADPLQRSIEATYLRNSNQAFIEMSTASGLILLEEAERECMQTTTLGTGQLILHAIQNGVKNITLFIGGSATNDGGIGMAQALGYRFVNQQGERLEPIGRNLIEIAQIDDHALMFNQRDLKVKVICDVNNPFYGPNGAAYIYAPQKGANSKDLEHLDRGLQQLAKVLKQQAYPAIDQLAGAGAAGGLGGGAVAFLNAALISGIEMFLDISQLEEKICQADMIITGEGKLDLQTLQGKVISGVVALAKKHNVPTFAICGDIAAEDFSAMGLKQVYTVRSIAQTHAQAMSEAAAIVTRLTSQLLKEHS